jgi:tetratricopeptide (TPR) repeat protein
MMRTSVPRQNLLPAIIIVAGFTVIAFLTGAIAAARPPIPDGYEDTDLNVNGSRAKGFAFGMEGLVADVYWMRALQYLGNKLENTKTENINIEDLRPLNPRLLYPLLDKATDLDPHFIAAYSYGAVVLPAVSPDQAIALTSKGIANNPDYWRLYQHLGYVYWRLGRYDDASEMYSRGSQIAGAADFMKVMSAAMKTQGGSRETARAIYRQMLETTDDEQVRVTAERRLLEIRSLDEREAIDKALTEFKQRSGRCANSFAEILPALAVVKLPENEEFRIDRSNQIVDPSGAPYLLDKTGCMVKLDVSKTEIPLR